MIIIHCDISIKLCRNLLEDSKYSENEIIPKIIQSFENLKKDQNNLEIKLNQILIFIDELKNSNEGLKNKSSVPNELINIINLIRELIWNK